MHNAEDKRRPLTSLQKLESMLAVAIRNPSAFQQINQLLTKKDLKVVSYPLSFVWGVVQKFFRKNQTLPTQSFLVAEISTLLEANPQLLSDSDCDVIDNFIAFSFDPAQQGKDVSRSQEKAQIAIKICQEFLEEIIAQSLQTAVDTSSVSADIPLFLQQINDRVRSIRAVAEPSSDTLFENENWDQEKPPKLHATGIYGIDQSCGGGIAEGEILALMGGTGTCKTVIALQLCCSFIKKAQLEHCRDNTKTGIVFYLSTELDKDDIKYRLLSCLAQVPISRLQVENARRYLSRATTPAATPETQYEKRIYSSEVGFISEYDRVAIAAEAINRHFRFVSCMVSDKNPEFGSRGIYDIVDGVQNTLNRVSNGYPVFFVLDHALGFAESVAMAIKDPKSNPQYTVLRSLPFHLRSFFAKKYSVPVVLLHHLASEYDNKPPTFEFHTNMAMGCKALPVMCDFAFVVGTLTRDTRLATLRACKVRRVSPPSPFLIQLDGELNRIVDASHSYMLSPTGNSFIAKSDYREFSSSVDEESFDDFS